MLVRGSRNSEMATIQRSGIRRRVLDVPRAVSQHGSRSMLCHRTTVTASSSSLQPPYASYNPHLPTLPPTLVPRAGCTSDVAALPYFLLAASPFYDPNPTPQHPNKKNKDSSKERQISLGRTIRTLQPLLPTLLQDPLPSHIISPSISLHLFPTTHPHLPTVRGRVAYSAALWTAPVAWGQIPFLGRLGVPGLVGKDAGVRLVIESERMFTPCPGHERLVVRWRTADKTEIENKMTTGEAGAAIRPSISGVSEDGASGAEPSSEPFRGIFIFEFDDQGRIGKHTIETVDTDDSRRGATRFISLAEWLMRLAKGKASPTLAPGELAPGM